MRMTDLSTRGAAVALMLSVAACAEAPPPAPAAPKPPASAQVTPQPATATALPAEGTQTDAQGRLLANDPSAPADTPLCGRAARESNGISNAVYADGLRQDGACASYACFDPLTATYIGMDGQRHVCR